MRATSRCLTILKNWWPIIIGLIFALAWFRYNISLPDGIRGLKCCDAGEYISHASESKPWNHSGRRAFGYILYLSGFYNLALWRGTFSFSSFEWLTPALYVQLLVWLVTCFILFLSLRREDKHYRYLFLGILLAHPALSAYAALSLTEVLSTSLFSLAMLCVRQLSSAPRRFWLWSLLAALSLGYATAIRPNFLAVFALTGLATGVTIFWRGLKEGWPLSRVLLSSLIAWFMFAAGTIPTVGKAVQNCARDYGQICIVDPTTTRFATDQTLWMGLTHARVWSSHTTGLRGTDDALLGRLASRCYQVHGDIKGSPNPYSWLLQCYKSYPIMVPAALFKKLIAGYDHHHLNAYAADQTSPFEYYLNKVYSFGSFLGLCFAIFLCLRALLQGSLYKYMYLVLPICFVLVQINFHIEARYFLPTVPLFLLTFLNGTSKLRVSSILSQISVGLVCLLLIATSVLMSHEWYLRDCNYMHERIPLQFRVKGLMTDCPTPEEVRRQLNLYAQKAPEWPPNWLRP
jgi:hypothetical protein